jgi:dsRNA-specific ribonuclease
LAILGVKLELYNYIEVASSHVYESFLQLRQQCENIDISTIESTLFVDKLSTCDIKTLSDTMEALIGAVYIDSGGSLDEIYKIIEYCNILPQINFEGK